ncbi:MAG TPA: carboxymuconolactone decarboxylase family protein [Steroidobacteraceae bacterium]|nr:carboxymuconolactone decarboxylase family protein [Steroidobacteraceae bacterium]
MTNTVRIPPLAPEDFSQEQASLVGDWKHLIFSRVLVHSPRMYRTFVAHLAELITRTNLPPRDRQIVCLRMLQLCDEVYEKTHHITISRKVGLSGEEISSILDGQGDCLTAFERAVLGATDELFRRQRISDDTWSTLAARYSRQQLMEIVFLAGCYQTMAMLTKSFGMQLEPDLESFNALRSYA